jgi:hypothetical protein
MALELPLGTPDALLETLVDAKGDLLVGTGDDAVDNLAAGADGRSLFARSSEASGLAWLPIGDLYIVTGTTNNPTVTSAEGHKLVPQMEISEDFGGDPILIFFTGVFSHGTAGAQVGVRLYEGAVGSEAEVSKTFRPIISPGANQDMPTAIVHAMTPPSGERNVQVRFNVGAGTGTADGSNRSLVVARLRGVTLQ